ncbi:MAG TPA: glycosyltransferase [bacterium]|jgi:glycosyltransferase involved in cell wall biosynthesis|nr:glycosyltransferase [bacterium]
MRIAMISPPHNPLPGNKDIIWAPGLVIDSLVEGLVKKGHKVTLFAPADSQTSARLESVGLNSISYDYPRLRFEDRLKFEQMYVQYELMFIHEALTQARAGKFDIIHAHDLRRLMYFSDTVETPITYTFHGIPNRDLVDNISKMRFKKFKKNSHIIVAAKTQIDKNYMNVAGVVPHGIDIDEFVFDPMPKEKKLLFSGRLIEFKRPDIALRIAKNLGVKIIISGSQGDSDADRLYFDQKIKPYINSPWVEYRKYVPRDDMPRQYAEAYAMLHPNVTGEPFGFVTIESQACGTPIIGFNSGATPELVTNGKTGFIVEPGDEKAMERATKNILNMPQDQYGVMRRRCREHIKHNFTVEKMVDGYERVYEKIIKSKK